ncbi:MAG: F0F1 ATP synthase subunit B [Proteobacteria bacterium]|nr:F0F1 ATP synthase subunit B [Pseudomonadota bacterium]
MATNLEHTTAETTAHGGGTDAKAQLFNGAFMGDTLFWTGLSFVLFMVMIWRFVLPTINTALDARAARIRDDLDHASAMRNEAQQALAAYEKHMRTARQEAHDIIVTAKAEAEKIIARKTAELEQDLARRSEEARNLIEQAKNKAMMDVRDQVAELALIATEKLLDKAVDKKTAGEMTDAAIKQMSH